LHRDVGGERLQNLSEKKNTGPAETDLDGGALMSLGVAQEEKGLKGKRKEKRS